MQKELTTNSNCSFQIGGMVNLGSVYNCAESAIMFFLARFGPLPFLLEFSLEREIEMEVQSIE